MAETETGQERTEAATSRKRARIREEGSVPKSQELNTVVLMTAGVVAFYNFIDRFIGELMMAMKVYFERIADPKLTIQDVGILSLDVGYRTLHILAPFFILFVIVAIAVNVFQVGFMFTWQALQPKFNKLNPIPGIQKMFSVRSRVELLKAMMKMFIIAPVMIYSVYESLPGMMGLIEEELWDILIHIGWSAYTIAIRALIILLILALIDYVYQRWQYEQDIKMTKQEVKQEAKDIQGDPHIRSRIRSIQMEMARRRMMEQVPEAEVVVTNPTEYAIALKYKPDEMPAPQIVAKGKNLIAKRIKELAVEYNIPIVENRVLAQSLYKLADVGGLVPPDLYQAVAEVLAYVYRLNKKVSQEV